MKRGTGILAVVAALVVGACSADGTRTWHVGAIGDGHPPSPGSVGPVRSGGTGGGGDGGTAATRPNIVFVLTDDLSWNLVSHMPQVQQLQGTGTTFPHYDVVDSLCCPSRTAIFTGEYPHDNGVFTNAGSDGGYLAYRRHRDAQNSFALALQRAGYATGFYGKYLNGYTVGPSHVDPRAPGWTDWHAVGRGGYDEFNYWINDNGVAHHIKRAIPRNYLTDVIARKAADFVDTSAAAGTPFMIETATFAPHRPYTPAPRYRHTADGLTYPRTAAYGRQPSHAPPWLAPYKSLTPNDNKVIRTAWQRRVESVQAVDDLITTIRARLRADHVARNTYIVFSSDNGYHMGEYNLLPGKQTAFDTDINVPLVVSGPGVGAGRTENRLASNIDLAPTFEQIAGAPVGDAVDGVSLLGLLHGRTPAQWQQAVLIEHHHGTSKEDGPDAQPPSHADPPSYEAVRTATALYVRYATGTREYYRTDRDPAELHNIAGQGVPKALRTTLRHLINCHDAAACQAAAA